MKIYNCTDTPLSIHGLRIADSRKGEFWRLSQEIMEEMPQYGYLGRRCCGGRLRFQTDSAHIAVRYTLKLQDVDINMGMPGSSGADIYYGSGVNARFGGCAAPEKYASGRVDVEKTFNRLPVLEQVTINLPRNDPLHSFEIGLDDGAVIKAPRAYAIREPILYYGSSITEGGCAPRPGTAYTSILSRWLDADYYNYGFSGSAQGEPEFARYIAGHERISLFVYDYDHNAPDAEHLEKTHEPFFRVIRRTHPLVPVIMLTRPDFDAAPEDCPRRADVIYRTYRNAKNAGDENVYFIDGRQLFGMYGRAECTVDGCHPNALGFMRMAETIYPLAGRILETVG